MGYFKKIKSVDDVYDKLLKENPKIKIMLVDNVAEKITVSLKIKKDKGYDIVALSSDSITSMDIDFINLFNNNRAILENGYIIMVDSDSEVSNEAIEYLVKRLELDNLYACIGAIYEYNEKKTLKSLKNVVNTIEKNINALEYNQTAMLRNLIDRNIMGVADTEVVTDLIEILNNYMPNSSWNISSKKRNIFE